MKKFALSFAFYTLVFTSLFSQAQLATTADCHTLRASIEPFPKTSVDSQAPYRFILEKEIRPNLWQKQKVLERISSEVLFTDLPPATYRVTIISPQYFKNKRTKIYHHLAVQEVEKIKAANTFLSNVIPLTLDKACDLLKNQNDTGNIEYAQKVLKVFPNPVQDKLWISWPVFKKINQISLYNLMGNLIRQISLTNNHLEMDLQDIVPGIYILKATQNEQIISTERISVVR